MNLIDLTYFLICAFGGLNGGMFLSARMGVAGWIIGVPAGFILTFACLRGVFEVGAWLEEIYRQRKRRGRD